MKTRHIGRSLFLFVAAGLAIGILIAAPMIDQEQVNVYPSLTWAVGGVSTQKLAQVFTAGRDGRLSHVTLPITCTSAAILTVSIQETTAGIPNGSVLAEEVLPGTIFPPIDQQPAIGFRIVEFSKQPKLIRRMQYAIVLEAATVDSCGVYQSPEGDFYPAGSGYFDGLPSPPVPGWRPLGPRNDLPFQTFMDERVSGRVR